MSENQGTWHWKKYRGLTVRYGRLESIRYGIDSTYKAVCMGFLSTLTNIKKMGGGGGGYLFLKYSNVASFSQFAQIVTGLKNSLPHETCG